MSEVLRGVPPHLIDQGRFHPFVGAVLEYGPLMDQVVADDATKLSIPLVRQMPFDSGAIFRVAVAGQQYPVGIFKAESIPNIVSLRLSSPPIAGDFILDAHLRRPRPLLAMMERFGMPFVDSLPSNTLAVEFDLMAKIDGKHYPPLRASTFLPWALDVFKPYNPTHLLAEWEPDSDNHAQFYRQLTRDPDPVKAVQTTWTHNAFTNLGAELIPQIGIIDFDSPATRVAIQSGKITRKESPLGFPSTVVRAIYKLK